MIKTIIFKEIKELRRDSRFKIAALLVLILLVVAAITSVNQFKAVSKQHDISKQKERELWDTKPDKNPHSAAHDGTYVFKPKNALSLLDNGINSYTGNAVLLEAHYRNQAQFSDAYDEMDFARNHKLTLNFILLYLFPLLILLIGFNMVTKEKEQDTLRLLKSQGVKPTKLIIGKWLSVFSLVFLVTSLVFIILGICLCIIDSNDSFALFNFIGIYFSYLFYYAIILTLTLLISTLSKTSGISLVTSLAVWVLFCFIMPKIATNVSNQLYPYPTKQAFTSAIEEEKANGFNGHDPNNEKGVAFKKAVLKENGVSSIEELDFNYTGLIMQKSEEESSKIYAKHYNKLYAIFEQQNTMYQSLAFLSPYIPTRLFSMDLAHTGYPAEMKFSDKTDAYRLQVQEFLNYNMKDNSKYGEWSYKMTTEEFKKLPKFSFQNASLSAILKWNVTNLVILLVWLLLPFLLLIRSSNKI